jgi:hypothetical protein
MTTTPQDLTAVLSAVAAWAFLGALAALLALLPLWLIERRRRRHWRHEYDQLIATHHNVRDRYTATMSCCYELLL